MKTWKSAMALVWMAASACYAQEPVKVVVLDFVDTSGSMLENAASTARRAFRLAGIETDWIICRVPRGRHSACPLPPANTYLQAKIVPSPGQLKVHESLGMALAPKGQPGFVSFAFYRHVKQMADSAEQSVFVLLAYVMAHEIAHLLGLPHSPSGIMKESLSRLDIAEAAAGRLVFTTEDARALRAAITQR